MPSRHRASCQTWLSSAPPHLLMLACSRTYSRQCKVGGRPPPSQSSMQQLLTPSNDPSEQPLQSAEMHNTCWYNACIWVAESNTRDSSALLPGAQFQPHQNDAAGTLASRPQGKRLAHTAPKATAASGKLPARSCLRHPWTCQQHGSAVPSKDKGWSSVLMQRHQGQLLLATWMRAYWLDRASCWSTNRSNHSTTRP